MDTSENIIESLTPERLDQAVPLMRAMFAEGKLRGVFNEPHWKRTWTTLLDRNVGQVLIVWRDLKPVGVILGALLTDGNTGELRAGTTNAFVLPEFRNRGVFDRLMQVFEDWAKSRGAQTLLSDCFDLSESENKKITGWFANRGFAPEGLAFRKSLWEV